MRQLNHLPATTPPPLKPATPRNVAAVVAGASAMPTPAIAMASVQLVIDMVHVHSRGRCGLMGLTW